MSEYSHLGITHIAVGGILVVVGLLIGIALLSPLNTAINTYATSTPTPDTTSVTLLKLVPTVLVAAFLIAGVAYIVIGARQMSNA